MVSLENEVPSGSAGQGHLPPETRSKSESDISQLVNESNEFFIFKQEIKSVQYK